MAFALTGLESKKTYDAYLVAMDDEDGGDYGGNTQAAVTKRTFTAASADGHLGGVAAVTAASPPAVGEQMHATRAAAFDPEIFEYRTFVNVTTASVKVTLTANDTQSDGLITVNGTARAGGVAFDVPLAHGVTVLAVGRQRRRADDEGVHVLDCARVDDTVANATLSFLEVTMDDGVVLNSTDLGGAPWPKCVKGCDANSRAVLGGEPGVRHGLGEDDVRAPSRSGSARFPSRRRRRAPLGRCRAHLHQGAHREGRFGGCALGLDAQRLARRAAAGGDRVELVVTAGDGVTKRTYSIDVDRIARACTARASRLRRQPGSAYSRRTGATMCSLCAPGRTPRCGT